MDLKVTTLDGKAAGSIALADEIFGLEPRADILQRMVRWQLSKRQAGTHKTKTRGEIAATTDEDVQAEGHRPRPPRRQVGAAVPRRRQGLRPGRAQPRPRPAEEGAGAGAEARALRQGQEREADRPRRGRASRSRRPRRSPRSFAKLGLANALIIDGAAIDDNFRLAARNIPQHRRAAGPGHQRLRHPAPRHAGPDQGRRRGADGAVQMIALSALRRDPQPGHHREVDGGFRAQQGRLQRSRRARPRPRSRRRSRRCSRSR